MAGLFGGARRALQGFNAPGRDGLSMADKITLAGSAIGGQVDPTKIRQFRADMLTQQRERQQLAAQTALEDRLRAQLSPADSPQGSGTGAAPDVQQQMNALNEARLLNPAVADKFAPFVQGNRMRDLTQGLPLEQRLAIELNPERAGQSFASQFEDMPLAMGTVRSRGSQSVAAAPRVEQFGDRFGAYDPMTGQTTYSQPRGPTFAENTDRITAERPQIASLSPGQQAFGVDPYGGTTSLAQNSSPRPLSDGDQTAISKAELAIQGINTATGRAQGILGQLESGQLNLGPVSNLASRARNLTGQSDQNSLNYESLMNWAKEARDAILSANTGVQTDGDAVRALDRIITTPNDERVVIQSLQRFIEAQRGTATVFQRDIDRRMGQYQNPMAAPQGQGQGQQPQARRQITPEQARQMLRERGVAGY